MRCRRSGSCGRSWRRGASCVGSWSRRARRFRTSCRRWMRPLAGRCRSWLRCAPGPPTARAAPRRRRRRQRTCAPSWRGTAQQASPPVSSLPGSWTRRGRRWRARRAWRRGWRSQRTRLRSWRPPCRSHGPLRRLARKALGPPRRVLLSCRTSWGSWRRCCGRTCPAPRRLAAPRRPSWRPCVPPAWRAARTPRWWRSCTTRVAG
mmetsp:Transcript_22206/g.57864  ORF Transcript_22206/g.57864 Transcript_22206/m.57864 type:complete len:205 (+) Transcript_22206:86-700(+)